MVGEGTVNLQFRAFYKILKKHDKLLPFTPCRQFYMSRLQQQNWIDGDFRCTHGGSGGSRRRGGKELCTPRHCTPDFARPTPPCQASLSPLCEVTTNVHSFQQHFEESVCCARRWQPNLRGAVAGARMPAAGPGASRRRHRGNYVRALHYQVLGAHRRCIRHQAPHPAASSRVPGKLTVTFCAKKRG